MVAVKAVNFRYGGMVIRGTIVGGMLLEIINPAKTQLVGSVMELIRSGLFSLIEVKGEK